MKPPALEDVIFFETSAQLRAWFEANHETAAELWLGYYLKKTGRPSVSWQDVVDQELCFGWIDSVRYPLSEGVSAQRITPRRKGSVWSGVNIRRFQELDAQGLAHAAGRAAFARRDAARSGIYAYENRAALEPAMEATFRRRARAWRFFETQAPWYRRNAAHWVTGAKRPETRERRLLALIESSAKGERIARLQPRPGPRSP